MSEVARLREQIRLECEAMAQIAHGFAAVAGHDIINRRYTALGNTTNELAKIIGKRAADDIEYEMYDSIVR